MYLFGTTLTEDYQGWLRGPCVLWDAPDSMVAKKSLKALATLQPHESKGQECFLLWDCNSVQLQQLQQLLDDVILIAVVHLVL